MKLPPDSYYDAPEPSHAEYMDVRVPCPMPGYPDAVAECVVSVEYWPDGVRPIDPRDPEITCVVVSMADPTPVDGWAKWEDAPENMDAALAVRAAAADKAFSIAERRADPCTD